MRAIGSLALDKASATWSVLHICCCINIEAALAAVLADLDLISICLEKIGKNTNILIEALSQEKVLVPLLEIYGSCIAP